MTTALISAGYALLRVVGRWVLRRLSEKGRRWLLRYMQEKADKFRERAATLAEAGRSLRSRWNAGRARRWEVARSWIRKHWYRLTRKGARLLEGRIADRIPFQVDDFEDYQIWQHTPEGQQVQAYLLGRGLAA